MTTVRPLGLKGRDAVHKRLSLGARARMPDGYMPGERSYPNLQHVRHWRDQPGSSCVGHGTMQAWEVGTVRHGGSVLEPRSRLHAYELGLLQQTPRGMPLQDEGTYINYVLSAVKQVGVTSEALWPPTRDNVAKRAPQDAEDAAIPFAGGDFWQINGKGDRFWREVCWAIDTFGPVIVGKLVGNVYAEHHGDSVLAAPSATEVWIGGHCTVLMEHERYGLNFIELNSWQGWGFSKGVVGSDGATRQIQSLARVSRNWLSHPWHMNAWVWVPAEYEP